MPSTGNTKNATDSTHGKKQKSISSFFTPKTSAPGKKPTSACKPASNRRLDDENDSQDSLFVEERPTRSGGPLLPVHGSNNDAEGRASASSKRARRDDDDEENDSDQAKELSDSTAVPIRQGAKKKAKLSTRTSKYVYDESYKPAAEDSGDASPKTSQKEALHRAFVKKLGHADSIAEIKRRNFVLDDANGEEDENEAEEEEEDSQPAKKPSKGSNKAKAGKKAETKLTPLEKQMLEIKRKHMDTILVIEVGYKFRFFGEDARIAARELSIVCIPGKYRYDEHPSEQHLTRFASASIPVHRLHVHVKRLVTAGHKVGVVRQLETAALKAAGDNRNTPFVRKLTNLYTKGTYIDDVEGLEGSIGGPSSGAPATGYLLCITESNAKGSPTDEKVHVGIVAVQPATGDVIYDDFEDGFMRSETETRLLHIAPCELLVVGYLSKATDKLVQHLSGSSTNVLGDKIRVERVESPKTMLAQSHSHVAAFYADMMKASGNTQSEKESNLLEKVLELPDHVTICLSAMITHMTDYGLEHVFDLTKYFQSFSARSHMLLNGNTLASLELFTNQSDHSERGSLFWSLDRTRTRFGQRLLRKWVGRPLLDKAKLQERVEAVEELKEGSQSVLVEKLKKLLSRTKSDLERSLIRIYYGKCSRPELLTVLQTMQRISDEFVGVKSPSDAGFKSNIINEAIASLPMIAQDIVGFLDKINAEAAKNDDKYWFFRESSETEEIERHKMSIQSVEQELNDHLEVAAEKLKEESVEYVTVSGIEYLIEVKNAQLKNVPASWNKISGTKKISRFHTPEVVQLIRKRDQQKEALAATCDVAFAALLASISTHYQALRDCIQSLSIIDCLLSLASVAEQTGYVKPEFTDTPTLEISQGRHPMVEQLLLETYVPNDTSLTTSERALLITGPNMGGKSSYVRHIALIAIMGQIGSYVPAASARLGLLDAVFTRMGAFDNLLAGASTFMVELSETADILKQATGRSLVLLDELGRGTSTHDGVAIAHAVLHHLVRNIQCLTLFITHYQSLSRLAGSYPNGELKNVHMRFEEREAAEGEGGVTFLYEVGEGVAYRSYGLNVARLAQLPRKVIELAGVKSKAMEEQGRAKRLTGVAKLLGKVVADNGEGEGEAMLEQLVSGIEQL
ncbi:MAG: Mismatch repair protein msh3 [Trizodia sp. TS-e1964]|nr:MAG: Mismatch repair protein msh3 [Trizodia sp. TS-e1964]